VSGSALIRKASYFDRAGHKEETHFPTAPSPTTTHLMVCMMDGIARGVSEDGT